ncbi:hypothetical protein [Pseudonocardia sp.]|uniref:hypothetical protein n=1 Tax=Pseudonocardia sp. TaxID=60912 RepID=UPI0031FBB1A2
MLLLTARPEGNMEIPTFGLVSELVGRSPCGGRGTPSTATTSRRRATCGCTPVVDHPHALGNYLARGFRPLEERRNRRELR